MELSLQSLEKMTEPDILMDHILFLLILLV